MMENSLVGKTFVFTGDLATITRKQAMLEVEKRGGICKETISKKTDYLVVGLLPLDHFLAGTKSTKIKKAEEYINKGIPIKIITDLEFFRMIKQKQVS